MGSSDELVVTTPRSGARTFYRAVTVRGFLCRQHDVVWIENATTDRKVMASTNEVCDGRRCVYTFSASTGDLAVGVNDLKAIIPTGGEPIEFPFRITRTALVLR